MNAHLPDPGPARWTFIRRDTVSLRDIADMLFRKKAWIVAGLLLVVGLAAAYVELSPRQYRSETLFLIKQEHPAAILTASDTLTVITRELLESQMATEAQLLTSDELLTAVLFKAGIVKEGSDGKVMQRALRKLRKNLRVTPGARSEMISVEVTADSAAAASSLLTTLSSLYVEKHQEIHKAASDLPFYREAAGRALAELDQAQKALADFDQANNTVMLEQQKAQKTKDLADLEAAYRESQNAQQDAQARNEILEKQLNATAPRITTQTRSVPNQYSTERLNTMLVELHNKRTELLTKFKPTDRMVQQVDQEIAETLAAFEKTRADVSKEEATDVNPVRQTLQADLLQSSNHLAGLQARAHAVQIQVSVVRNEIDRLAELTGRHDELAGAVKKADSYYQTLSTQLEQAKLAGQMDQQHVASVEVAEAPTRANQPEPVIDTNFVADTVLGVLLVLGIALLGGLRRRHVFTPWELEGLTGAPVLGAVPRVALRKLPASTQRVLEALKACEEGENE
jgi:uncharacterized protein involved in exopolysaccharide biosynthesis